MQFNARMVVPVLWFGRLPSSIRQRNLLKGTIWVIGSVTRPRLAMQISACYSTFGSSNDKRDSKVVGKMSLAENLASIVEESSKVDMKRPRNRMELKRSLELRIKKRVKEQYMNGKFHGLMENVVASSDTLQDAYNCIRLNSNVDLGTGGDEICFKTLAEELSRGAFDVSANIFSISTKGARKEVLVLPKLKLKIVQEAIRIVLEVVYRPHFSKISHGCRSGRGHSTALKYICKEISDPDWWFTVPVNKKLNALILAKLYSVMEERIEDPSIYAIISNMFDAQVLNLEFGGFPKGHGLPQEGVLSAILMNIYLDLFDCEIYRLSMKYVALQPDYNDCSHSKLRSWFRSQRKGNDVESTSNEHRDLRIHSCRVMDEIFISFSGPKDVALGFKSEILNYLQNSLHLDVDNKIELIPCNGPHALQFLGTLVRRRVREGPALRAVHKLKEKVKLFSLQKREAWNAGTVRIGKKSLGHGLKKVKESEIKHLVDTESILSQISSFRKAGMETDHWYKFLLKIWLQDINAKEAGSEEVILSKYVAEPSIPQELRDSFYEFQKRAEDYITSETAAALALFPDSGSSQEFVTITEITAPVNVIGKRLQRYGITTSRGHACTVPPLILQDDIQIINWFSGIVRRLVRWYSQCNNLSEVKLIISTQVRKSCVRTLAAKYRIHENEIEGQFDTELSIIPCTDDAEQETMKESLDSQASNGDEALLYGISYSGLCLLSLSRKVSQSRPCNCFVMGCLTAAQNVYALHVMERQKFPGWKTGFSSCIHPSLNRRRIGLCEKHLNDLYLGHISLQSIDFSAWK